MANTSLPNLTERTATANSDLIHVNSGGTDYKETKANFLSDVNSSITSLNNSLTQSSGSVSASVGSGSIDYFKFGSVVTIKIAINSLTISQDTTVATLPTVIRPRVDLDFVEPISNGRCFITSAGLLKPQFSLSNGILRGAFTYVV